jgi:hypothetical protein
MIYILWKITLFENRFNITNFNVKFFYEFTSENKILIAFDLNAQIKIPILFSSVFI